MMRTLSSLSLIFCLYCAGAGFCADDPNDIAGYGKTVWGMTPDQVAIAESPRAQKLDKPVAYKKSVGLVKIEPIEISSQSFEVMFLFDPARDELEQVNVTSVEKNNALVNAITFSNLEKLLTQKYGSPTYKKEGARVFWKLHKTSIDLSHLNIPKIFSQVSVTYRPIAVSNDAAKDL